MRTLQRYPDPGEFHPAWEPYREPLSGFLRDESMHHYRMVITRRWTMACFRADADLDTHDRPPFRFHLLTKRRVVVPAPYVGRPYCYWWWAATDELGRAIADTEVHREVWQS